MKQLNAPTQQALREIHERPPDELAVYSRPEGDVEQIRLAYRQPHGEEKARTAITDTLTGMGVITLAN